MKNGNKIRVISKSPLAWSCHRPACNSPQMSLGRGLWPSLAVSSVLFDKMADRIRNSLWITDALKEDMRKYVSQGLKHEEMLSFSTRHFPQYTWSICTLDRRLQCFDLRRTDINVTLEDVKNAVKIELEGPGQLLGYRATHKKIRMEHKLNVPRDLVHAVMFDLDPEGLEERGGVGTKKKCRAKGNFTTKGPDWVHSLDGHDKLMGSQNSTFLLAVYGSTDTASRRLLWLRIWVSNSDPKLIARWYLEYLHESRLMPSILRLDKGSETGVMATMHAYLRGNHGGMNPSDTVIFGPSTSNQVSVISFLYQKCAWKNADAIKM